MENNYVILKTYSYNSDAYILVAKLEAEGINCFIENENVLTANPLLSNAIGGIDVKIYEADLKRAKIILEEIESQKKLATENLDKTIPEDYKKVQMFCPKCDSSEVYQKKTTFFSSFGSQNYLCTECYNQWKE